MRPGYVSYHMPSKDQLENYIHPPKNPFLFFPRVYQAPRSHYHSPSPTTNRQVRTYPSQHFEQQVYYVPPTDLNGLDIEECAICKRDTSSSKSFFWFMCLILAGGALLAQLWDLTQTFLKYDVVTELSVSAPTVTQMPALSLCFPFTKILDIDQLDKHHPALADKLYDEKLAITDTENVLTIQDIFDMTPKETAVVKSCKYRIPHRYPLQQLNNSVDCAQTFKVARYYKQQYMCYWFSPLDTETGFMYNDVLSSLQTPGLFFEVTLDNKLFKSTLEIQAVIHDNVIIARANAFPIVLTRKGVNIKYNRSTYSNTLNKFALSYDMIRNIRKPAPYTTNCFIYEGSVFDSQDDCFDKCLAAAITELMHKVPFTAVLKEPVPLKHISTVDNTNDTLQKLVFQKKIMCRQQCTQPSCDERLYATNFVRKEMSQDLVFSVYVMSDPPKTTRYKERMSFSEYLVQFLSCFGIWYTIDFTTLITAVEVFARFYRYWRKS